MIFGVDGGPESARKGSLQEDEAGKYLTGGPKIHKHSSGAFLSQAKERGQRFVGKRERG